MSGWNLSALDSLDVHRTLHEVMRQYSLNRETLRLWKAKPLLIAVALLFSAAVPVMAQQVQVTLDPAQTRIEWTLGATLHVVHGTFKLRSGQMSYDPATGQASGEFVVDAASGQTGEAARGIAGNSRDTAAGLTGRVLSRRRAERSRLLSPCGMRADTITARS